MGNSASSAVDGEAPAPAPTSASAPAPASAPGPSQPITIAVLNDSVTFLLGLRVNVETDVELGRFVAKVADLPNVRLQIPNMQPQDAALASLLQTKPEYLDWFECLLSILASLRDQINDQKPPDQQLREIRYTEKDIEAIAANAAKGSSPSDYAYLNAWRPIPVARATERLAFWRTDPNGVPKWPSDLKFKGSTEARIAILSFIKSKLPGQAGGRRSRKR